MGVTVGARVLLTISDPFELSQTLEGELVGVDSFSSGAEREGVLVLLEPSLVWCDRPYNYLVFGSRYGPGMLGELESGPYVICNGVGVDEESAKGPPPWGAQAWRGGLGVIATLQLLVA